MAFPRLSPSLASSGGEFRMMLWIREDAHHVVLQDPECARHMMAVKVIRLHKGAITVLRVVNRYLSTGSADGNVHFYEARLGLVGWFEEIHIGKSSASC
jgi:hypothetical protein